MQSPPVTISIDIPSAAQQPPSPGTPSNQSINGKIMMKSYLVAVIGLCLIAVAPSTWAEEELTGTLKKIKDAGSISLGHRESSVPFSYYDDKNQVVGYSHELLMMVVDAVKKKLNMPNLEVKD